MLFKRKKEPEKAEEREGMTVEKFIKLVDEHYPGYTDGVRTVLHGSKPYDSYIQAGIILRRFGNNIEAEITIDEETSRFLWRRTPL